MCLAKAYVADGQTENLVLEDVTLLTIEGDHVNLRNLFGQREEMEGSVREVDFNSSSIRIEKAP